MSVSASPDFLSALVTMLRSVGCVYAEDEARLIVSAARTPEDAAAMVARRAAGLPLEHVIGWAEFCGLRILLEPGVFVPRRRTEFLVRQAEFLARRTGFVAPQATPADHAALAQHTGPATAHHPKPGAHHPKPAARQARPITHRPIVVDLCCGSGAVGAALAVALGEVELHATDIDPATVRCARRNLAAFGGRVYQGDLYDPLPAALQGQVDILTANAPYVPTAGIALLPTEARSHEPVVALDGGADGLAVLRRVIAGAPAWLAPGGHLLTETSARQAPLAAEAMASAGLRSHVSTSEELGTTVVTGTSPQDRSLGSIPTGPT